MALARVRPRGAGSGHSVVSQSQSKGIVGTAANYRIVDRGGIMAVAEGAKGCREVGGVAVDELPGRSERGKSSQQSQWATIEGGRWCVWRGVSAAAVDGTWIGSAAKEGANAGQHWPSIDTSG